MSHIASAWAWQQDVKNPVRKLILLHMADSASEQNEWQSWYSLNKIAERCNCSRGSVRTHLADLVDMGLLTLTVQSSRKGRPAKYRLHVGDVKVQQYPTGGTTDIQGGTRDVPEVVQEMYQGGTRDVPEVVQEMYQGGTRDVPKPVRETVKKPVRETNSKKKPPPDFVKMVTDLHKKILPELESVVLWSDDQTRAKHLKKIWLNSEIDTHDPSFWEAYFGFVRTNDWWMGRTTASDGKGFKASFEFLVHPKQFVRIVEGCLNLESGATYVA